jgi:polysaccharide biosynthesis/export protein
MGILMHRLITHCVSTGSCILGAWLIFSLPVLSAAADSKPPQASGERAVSDQSSYDIGPGDILTITFANSQELNQKVQVSQSGEIPVPLLSSPLPAAGLTPLELSQRIGKALEDAKQLQHPFVSVFVEQQNSHWVTVMGQVQHPGVFPLTRPTPLEEAMSLAGGLTASAGATVTVVHHNAGAHGTGNSGGLKERPTVISLGSLSSTEDNLSSTLLRPGDVVTVSSAPQVYVVGAVGKAGGFTLQDPVAGITALQAIALAEGLQGTAAGSRGLIIRRSMPDQQRQLIPVDLSRIMTGKAEDLNLKANDILFVPQSGAKKTLAAMERAAEVSVAEIAGYGVGLRLSK